jgi:hypothetical protein
MTDIVPVIVLGTLGTVLVALIAIFLYRKCFRVNRLPTQGPGLRALEIAVELNAARPRGGRGRGRGSGVDGGPYGDSDMVWVDPSGTDTSNDAYAVDMAADSTDGGGYSGGGNSGGGGDSGGGCSGGGGGDSGGGGGGGCD